MSGQVRTIKSRANAPGHLAQHCHTTMGGGLKPEMEGGRSVKESHGRMAM